MNRIITMITILMLFGVSRTAFALTYTVQVPSETNVVYIVGEPTATSPGDWSTFTKMDRVNENTFSITLANATEDMGYEYCAGPDWPYEEIDANGQGVSHNGWAELDVAYAFKAYYAPLTYTVQMPPEAQEAYITGDFNDWGDFVKMDKIGENTFSVTIDGATPDMWYQYCTGPGWAYQEVDADGKGLGRTDGGGVDIGGIFLAFFDPGSLATLTYTVEVPDGVNVVYIVGDVVGGWDRFVKMDKVGDNTFSITLDNVDKNTEYEYCAGPGWNYEESNADGESQGHAGWAELDVAFDFWNYFDPNADTSLTYTVKVPAETQTVFLIGDFNDWGAFIEMERIDDNTFSVSLEATDDMGYEYCAGPKWAYAEMDADGTEVSHDGWAELDTAFGFMGYASKIGNPTGIINPTASGKTDLIFYSANKIIRVTGIFDDVSIYNITGQKLQSEKATNYFESKPLNPGIYIVKTDKQVGKVVVR